MSAILKAVLKACDIDNQDKDESRQDFLRRCVKAVSGLGDKDWEGLDGDAQKWFNSCADVLDENKAKKRDDPLPDFPDVEREEAPARRRASDDKGKDDESAVKVGMKVTLITQKGREFVGKVVELDKKVIVLDVDGRDKEFELDGDVGSINIFNDGRDDPPGKDDDATPKAGDQVKFTTKRGKKVEGELVKMDDEEVVVKTADGEEEFMLSRIEGGVTLVGSSKGASDDKGSSRRSASASDDKGKEKDGKAAREPRVTNGDISIGQRIRELIVDNIGDTQDEIAGRLKKEQLEFRDNTLQLNYKETHKVIALMKDRGWAAKSKR